MNEHHDHHHIPEKKRSWWSTFPGMACAGILAIIAYTLVIDHRQHIAENWVYLLFLICPVMHLFMHHGHNHHHPHDDKEEK